MDLTIRPATTQERLYAGSQSSQISAQTGYMGGCTAVFEPDGQGHINSESYVFSDQRGSDFKMASAEVISTLRFDWSLGNPLQGIAAMRSYCEKYPEANSEGERRYVFRADMRQYAFLMCMDPDATGCRLHCYGYERRWLERHMENAEKGIRFIDPSYKELFRIPDGDSVRIITSTDEELDRVCRYIDDCHVEVGSRLYHICEFAEIMERIGNTVIPLRSSLPEQCYGVMPSTGEVIIVKKGETGCYRTDIDMGSKAENEALVREYNKKAGVTPTQAQAMMAGSMFGWACPAADPKNYDADGRPIKPRHQDRGDER